MVGVLVSECLFLLTKLNICPDVCVCNWGLDVDQIRGLRCEATDAELQYDVYICDWMRDIYFVLLQEPSGFRTILCKYGKYLEALNF